MDNMSDAISKLLEDPETVMLTKPEPKLQLPSVPNDTLQTVMKFMPLISDMQKDDDTTRLLKALRPFLSNERRKKLDEAAKLLRLTKLLPLIRQLNL